MKILMIVNYMNFNSEGGNSRFTYLLNMIDYKRHEVELITSGFRHESKAKRDLSPIERKKLKYKVTLIDEPGYKKNISLKRFYSHYILSKNLKKYLKSLDYKPDVIYCSIPSLDFAKVASKYAKRNKIRFILDVQDLWPEAFKMIINIPIISDLVFYPFTLKANKIYASADKIIGVSETYVARAKEANKKDEEGLAIFLGTELKKFDEYKKKYQETYNDKIIRICYIGTLGHSYDIRCIIDAIKMLNDHGIKNIKFVVVGDGPLKDSFSEYAKSKKIDCDFYGRLQYEKMVGALCSCDIAVNPISHGAAQSIINKVGDYAAAGLPVVNTQECPEYRQLIEEYNCGLNCQNNDVEDIANKILQLVKSKELRTKLGNGNRKLAIEKFDREKTYKKIIKIIEEE